LNLKRFFLKFGCLCIAGWLIAACSTPGAKKASVVPGINIDGVEILNQLQYPVSDVQILVPSTGAFVGCGTILGGTSCSTSFPGREYRRNAVQVTWKERGQPFSTGDFDIDVPRERSASQEYWIKVVIFAPGQAGAKLVKNQKYQ